jgi:hypothetical protein
MSSISSSHWLLKVDSYPTGHITARHTDLILSRTQLLPYKITLHKWLKHLPNLRVKPDEELVLNAAADVLVVKAVKVSQNLRMWRVVVHPL